MIRDFGSFTRRGLLADLDCPAEIWADISQTEQGAETGEETVEDKDQPPACRLRVRDPKTQAHRGSYQ